MSPADLLGSIGRLTSLVSADPPVVPTADATKASADVAAEFGGAEGPAPALALIAPLTSAGDSLAGLRAPQTIDPNTAALGLASTDEICISVGGSTQSASGVARSLAPGRTSARATTTNVRLAVGAPKAPPPITPANLKSLTASLETRLQATPLVFAALALSAHPDMAANADPGALADPMANLSGQHPPEPTGIIASSILNAAIIPGWPPPVAPQPSAAPEARAVYAALDDLDEAQLLEFIAALGGDEVLRARLISACDDSDRRRKLLRAACFLATVIGAFVTALRLEIEELMGDFGLIAKEEAPEAWAGRIRLLLK